MQKEAVDRQLAEFFQTAEDFFDHLEDLFDRKIKLFLFLWLVFAGLFLWFRLLFFLLFFLFLLRWLILVFLFPRNKLDQNAAHLGRHLCIAADVFHIRPDRDKQKDQQKHQYKSQHAE